MSYERLLKHADKLEAAASQAAEAIRRDNDNRVRAHWLSMLADEVALTRTTLQEYIDSAARERRGPA